MNVSATNVSEYNLVMQGDILAPLIYLGSLFTCGIPGNILVIAVFILRRKSSAYRTIILVLSANDLLICGITIPFEFYYINHYLVFYSKWICKVFRFVNYLLVCNSILVLQLMAIERFRRVCKPMKVQMSNKIARICIFCILVFSIVYTLPNLYIRGIHVIDFTDNKTGYECSTSDDYKGSMLPIIYTLTSVVICVGNISSLVIVYTCIGHQIYKHFKFVKSLRINRGSFQDNTLECSIHTSVSDTYGQESPSKMTEHIRFSNLSFKRKWSSMRSSRIPNFQRIPDAQNNKCTKIAILITLFFMLSYIPHLTLSAISGIYGDTYLAIHMSPSVLHLVQRSYVINHVTNPIIYGFIDRRFRLDCKSITKKVVHFCCCLK